MADKFMIEHAHELFSGKKVLLLGDSNTRCIYKDLVYLIDDGFFVPLHMMKKKGEQQFSNDRLIDFRTLNASRNYVEVRQYQKFNITIEYHFLSKCYNETIINLLTAIEKGEHWMPDLVLMSSAVWDLSRYGPDGAEQYQRNMFLLLRHVKKALSDSSTFIWCTYPPVSPNCTGGFLVEQTKMLNKFLPFHVMEANSFAAMLMRQFNFEIVDLHYRLRLFLHRRADDGIHWCPITYRYMTNCILTHLCISWGKTLPGNLKGESIEKLQKLKNDIDKMGQEGAKLTFPTPAETAKIEVNATGESKPVGKDPLSRFRRPVKEA